ncbi:MAG: FtsW/RodA/SpoVE family cell cycle protein [Actinobacteria bacterium]|nr:FtsW/RodA/SpoVE family cell cycle protein [Actinomycetota bacterium]
MRIKEISFLVLTFIASVFGYYVLGLSNPFKYAAIINLPFLLLSFFNAFFLRNSDEHILPLVALLSNLGCINLYQIDSSYFSAQIRNIYIAALFSMFFTYLFSKLRKPFTYRFVFGVTGLLLFLIPMAFGKEVYGARLWISIDGFRFQPAELGRIFFILFLSGYFGEHQILFAKTSGLSFRKRFVYLIPALIMTLFSLILLVFVRDLGFSLLILSIFLASLFIASSNLSYIFLSLGIFGLGSLISYRLFDHVKNRIDAWLNPWSDPFGKSYQVLQSLFAYAEGNVLGLGLNHGFPELLPAAHTDMTVPIFAESCGILGSITVIAASFLISTILVLMSQKTKNSAEKIFLATSGFTIAFQVFLVVSGTLNLLPLTGLTVPFFSYGGSSLVSSMVLIQLSLLFSTRREKWIVQ